VRAAPGGAVEHRLRVLRERVRREANDRGATGATSARRARAGTRTGWSSSRASVATARCSGEMPWMGVAGENSRCAYR
jgi:hypothetical protein